jgi:hypothetical protein
MTLKEKLFMCVSTFNLFSCQISVTVECIIIQCGPFMETTDVKAGVIYVTYFHFREQVVVNQYPALHNINDIGTLITCFATSM